MDEPEVYDQLSEFFDVVVNGFPDVRQVLIDRTLEPKELRGKGSNTSLLSSSTTIKALAVAYHDLLEGTGFSESGRGRVRREEGFEPLTQADVEDAFRSKLPPMDSGDALDERWKATGVFEPPFVAPTARGANVRTLAMQIMEWVRS